MPLEPGAVPPIPIALGVDAPPTADAPLDAPLDAKLDPPVGARAARARRAADPVQEFFSIGEVCALTDLRPHVLRYWETQFRGLSPAKNRSGNRVYRRREVELVLLVKHLLYTEKYTLEGARQKLDAHRRGGDLRPAARAALARETAASLEVELREVLDVLEGRRAPGAPGSTGHAGGAGAGGEAGASHAPAGSTAAPSPSDADGAAG